MDGVCDTAGVGCGGGVAAKIRIRRSERRRQEPESWTGALRLKDEKLPEAEGMCETRAEESIMVLGVRSMGAGRGVATDVVQGSRKR